MIFYPSSLPCVSKSDGLTATAYAGVVRTPMEAGNSRQRRMHRVLPHMLSLTWNIAQPTVLAQWITWCNAHAWDEWIAIRLPGLVASRAGENTALTPIRFISDLAQELLQGQGIWYWRLSVTAEYQPTSDDLAPMPGLLGWIAAGTPGAPSPDWIVAGTPDNPSPWDSIFGDAAQSLAAP